MIFSVCAPPPPSLVGAYYWHSPDARAMFLRCHLLCNDTRSVAGGCITYWGRGGGTSRKDLIDKLKIYNVFVIYGGAI